ncbi:MAG: hypothetical protein HUK06_09820, partial [Bacteroidaceae bacterium]|nr:hypothetical protein [Bacteroidaceae bacterium]
HTYKSPRADGQQEFEITPALIEHFKRIEQNQFANYSPNNKPYVYGLFGKQDTLAHFRSLYESCYSNVIEFDGGHTMSVKNVSNDLVPLIKEISIQHQL